METPKDNEELNATIVKLPPNGPKMVEESEVQTDTNDLQETSADELAQVSE